MKTELCDVLGSDAPILSAPMAGAAGPGLVAAVCDAGGYGVFPLWSKPASEVTGAIADLRTRTDGNFAVNLNVGRVWGDHLQACIDAEIHAVSLFWGLDVAAIKAAKAGGLKVLYSVGSAEEARVAAGAGADVIVAQGWEAGGHVWGQVATMALVPAVVDAVDVPVVAAGGIADGRGMAAALMLGASGVWIGTRFLTSDEATIHQQYQSTILAADETQTEWYADLYDGGWPAAPHRALVNSTSRAWHTSGCPAPGARPSEGEAVGHRPDGAPVKRYDSYTPLAETTGAVEAMSLWAGQGVSLAREVKPASAIVDEIYQDAQRVIAEKAASFTA